MGREQHRHDITDVAWSILEPLLPRQAEQWGGLAQDNRNPSTAVRRSI